VELKYDGKSYFIGQEMWDNMTTHAAQRGMTIDEYIAEAFTMMKEQHGQKTDIQNNNNSGN
jgi:hypothetical protein